MQVFSQLRPANEVQLTEKIELKGGVQMIRTNESALRELFESSENKDFCEASVAQGGEGIKYQRSTNRDREARMSEYTFDDLKAELKQDLNTMITSNLEAFTGKFQLFYNELYINLEKYIHQEADRVIVEVKRGPHDLIRHHVRYCCAHTCSTN